MKIDIEFDIRLLLNKYVSNKINCQFGEDVEEKLLYNNSGFFIQDMMTVFMTAGIYEYFYEE